jgi:hypothetical protein
MVAIFIITTVESVMNEILQQEDGNNDDALSLTELGQVSEETKGTTSGPRTEPSVVPWRVF